MRFTAALELHGRTATGIEVPAWVVTALGPARRPAVSVTINRYTYRTTVGVMGGRTLLPVSAQVRAGAGVSAGEELEVDVELDHAPREVEVPAELAQALAVAGVREAFDALSFTNRKEHARSDRGQGGGDPPAAHRQGGRLAQLALSRPAT